MTPAQWAKDTAERALSTLVQSLLVFIPAILGPWNGEVGKAILAACLPPVATVLLNAVPHLRYETSVLWLDIAIRSIRTFSASILGALAATSFDLFDGSAWRLVALSAIMAAAAVIKGAIADKVVPNSITPASLAKKE